MIPYTRVQEIICAMPDRSPIWYGSVDYKIKINKKFFSYTAHNVVMKGDFNQIKSSDLVKKRALESFLGGGKEAKKKINKFDFNNIIIVNIIINKNLGYGIK